MFPIIQKYSALYDFDAIIPTDAIGGDGIGQLLEEFKQSMKEEYQELIDELHYLKHG